MLAWKECVVEEYSFRRGELTTGPDYDYRMMQNNI